MRRTSSESRLSSCPCWWLIAFAICLAGLFVVNPNEGKVVTLFGRYTGTEKRPGLWWANPFTARGGCRSG